MIAAVWIGGCGGTHGGASTGVTESGDVVLQTVPGPPFGVATTPDGRFAFVDVLGGRVLVFSTHGFVPRLIRTIPVPGDAVGCSLTRDGRLLLIANREGATVLSVARAESGAPHAVLGTLTPPPTAHVQAGGAIETASSADGRYVFVSLEYGSPGGMIAVYRIGSTSAPRFGPAEYVGAITLGSAVVGSALSPDGRYLYVTSEVGRQSLQAQRAPATHSKPPGTLAQVIGSRFGGSVPAGTLSVISVASAERDPADAVLATIPAQAQPVRVTVSPNGSVVWVTARASNQLLAFSAAKLLRDPARAMLADVRVGTAPVGVALFDNGNRAVVADSNRFNGPGAHAAITIVNTRAALAHEPAVIANLRSGLFPREVAVERNDSVLLVSDFASDQLEAVDVSRLR